MIFLESDYGSAIAALCGVVKEEYAGEYYLCKAECYHDPSVDGVHAPLWWDIVAMRGPYSRTVCERMHEAGVWLPDEAFDLDFATFEYNCLPLKYSWVVSRPIQVDDYPYYENASYCEREEDL